MPCYHLELNYLFSFNHVFCYFSQNVNLRFIYKKNMYCKVQKLFGYLAHYIHSNTFLSYYCLSCHLHHQSRNQYIHFCNKFFNFNHFMILLCFLLFYLIINGKKKYLSGSFVSKSWRHALHCHLLTPIFCIYFYNFRAKYA